MNKTRLKNPNSLAVLAVAAMAGMVLGAIKTMDPSAGLGLRSDFVAGVNGVGIRHSNYERALSMFQTSKRQPISSEDRRFVLERLVDEELLVQYAIERGLIRSDQNVRRAVLQFAMAGIDSEDSPATPDIQGVQRFSLESYFINLRKDADIRFEKEP